MLRDCGQKSLRCNVITIRFADIIAKVLHTGMYIWVDENLIKVRRHLKFCVFELNVCLQTSFMSLDVPFTSVYIIQYTYSSKQDFLS